MARKRDGFVPLGDVVAGVDLPGVPVPTRRDHAPTASPPLHAARPGDAARRRRATRIAPDPKDVYCVEWVLSRMAGCGPRLPSRRAFN